MASMLNVSVNAHTMNGIITIDDGMGTTIENGSITTNSITTNSITVGNLSSPLLTAIYGNVSVLQGQIPPIASNVGILQIQSSNVYGNVSVLQGQIPPIASNVGILQIQSSNVYGNVSTLQTKTTAITYVPTTTTISSNVYVSGNIITANIVGSPSFIGGMLIVGGALNAKDDIRLLPQTSLILNNGYTDFLLYDTNFNTPSLIGATGGRLGTSTGIGHRSDILKWETTGGSNIITLNGNTITNGNVYVSGNIITANIVGSPSFIGGSLIVGGVLNVKDDIRMLPQTSLILNNGYTDYLLYDTNFNTPSLIGATGGRLGTSTGTGHRSDILKWETTGGYNIITINGNTTLNGNLIMNNNPINLKSEVNTSHQIRFDGVYEDGIQMIGYSGGVIGTQFNPTVIRYNNTEVSLNGVLNVSSNTMINGNVNIRKQLDASNCAIHSDMAIGSSLTIGGNIIIGKNIINSGDILSGGKIYTTENMKDIQSRIDYLYNYLNIPI